MIIANSNVNMSSRRHFSQNVTSSQTSINKSARSFQLGMTSIRASYSQNEFYYSNNSHRSDDDSFGIPVYNRFGLLDDENDPKFSCTCPCLGTCKHEYATLMAIDEKEYSTIKLLHNCF